MKHVVVIGSGPLAIHAANYFDLNGQYSLDYVVPRVPEPTWTIKFSAWAKSQKLRVIISGDCNDVPHTQIDIAFITNFNKIVTPEFINRCGVVLNLHSAPLPKYRGVSPVNWALKNNETEHGVTLHVVDEGVDTGPIISQMKFTIYPEFEEVEGVYWRAYEYARLLFDQTMPILDKITPREQDNSLASFYKHSDDVRLGDRRWFTKKETCPR